MDEELKAKLLTYLNDVEAAAKAGKDFLIEQAPLYVQELLAWEFWSNSILAVAIAVPLLAFVVVLGFFVASEDNWSDRLLGMFIGFMICVIPGGFMIEGAYKAVKVSVAPRVVIVEKLHEAVK